VLKFKRKFRRQRVQ